MPGPLKNHGHEQFARAVAEGAALVAAHERGGFSGDYSNALKLSKRADVAARIKEYRLQLQESGERKKPDPEANTAQLLKTASLEALANDNYGAAITGLWKLAEANGDLEALHPRNSHAFSDAELIKRLVGDDPVKQAKLRELLVMDSFEEQTNA